MTRKHQIIQEIISLYCEYKEEKPTLQQVADFLKFTKQNVFQLVARSNFLIFNKNSIVQRRKARLKELDNILRNNK